MRITSMQIKKKLALMLASTLLVTSINVMPVEAITANQATGSESQNAMASMDLTLSVAALGDNQGNTAKTATGRTNLTLLVAELGANQGNTVKQATGSTNLSLQIAELRANQGNTIKSATGSTTLTLVITRHHLQLVEKSLPTCNTDGVQAHYQCTDSDCGKLFTDAEGNNETTLDELKIPALGHSYSTIWEKDAESHYHKCTRCSEIKDKAAHTYGEWTVEAEGGLRKRSCSVCGYEETEGLYAINVQNDGNGTASTDKTVATAGETVTLSTIPSEGFVFDKWEVTPDTVSITNNQFTMPQGGVTVKAMFKHVHSLEAVAEVPAGCITDGVKVYYKCKYGYCGKLFTDSEGTTETTLEDLKISALGHDWSDEWTVIKEPTATEEGKKEKTCKREGCSLKKYEIIPKTGTTDELPEGVSGSLEKDAEVASDAPIVEATLDNKKAELLEAANIFTEQEKQQIASQGAEARVWLEVSKTKEESIAEKDKTEIKKAATEIMGDNPDITYFDADLFKKVGDGQKCKLSEPGIEIKVTIQIPEALLRHDKTMIREYKIIRLHVKGDSSEVSTIGGTFDENTKEFTFMTDRFSTYAIAYKDVPATTVAPTITTEPTVTVGLTVTPEPTATAGPTATTEPTVTVGPTATTEPTQVPTVTMSLAPTKQPTVTKKPVTPTKKPTPKPTAIPKKTLEKNALSLNAKLKVSQTGSNINVSWGKVSGADGYNVYVQYCGKAFTAKSLNSVKSGKTTKITITKVNGKKLDLKKNFKVYVEAYKKVNGKKVTLGKTVTAHIIGRKNTECTNVKAVKVKKSSYTLKVGKTATIKASTVLVDKTKKQLSDKHAKEFRYATSNKKVATVSGSGKIKAVGKGSCMVYVYARNGYAKKVKVTVK